jgi:serine protease inhibitor
MRRILTFALCIAVIASLTACNLDNKSSAVKAPVYPKSISFDDYDSQRAVNEENSLDIVYKKALTDFSSSSASKILSGQLKNVSYSPSSLYMTLSLAGIGAKGSTQDEIFSALGTSGKSVDYLSNENSKLFRLLYSDNEIGKLKIANSLWLDKDIGFKNVF